MCWDIVLAVSIASGLFAFAALGLAVWHHLQVERGSCSGPRP